MRLGRNNVMIEKNQMSERYRNIIEEEIRTFNDGTSVTIKNDIPDTIEIPIINPKQWLKIINVICVFVDMKGSTQLSANTHERYTASAYQLFTGTAVRLFHEFEAAYIDVRGDGVFALFNKNQPYRALAAAITFKTFAANIFIPKIKELSNVEVGSHLGIDQETVLVRKIGLKRYNGRTDRQNEVWAGKPVNMAAKLSSLSDNDELLVSDRFYNQNITDVHALMSCGCPKDKKEDLWHEKHLDGDTKFDFVKAYSLKSRWCKIHGLQFCNRFLELDNDPKK